jgi:hypothetical protein
MTPELRELAVRQWNDYCSRYIGGTPLFLPLSVFQRKERLEKLILVSQMPTGCTTPKASIMASSCLPPPIVCTPRGHSL